MKKYKVIDLQGGDFMAYTHEEPLTLKDLRERFWYFYQDQDLGEEMKFKDLTKEFIEELWLVKIEESN